MFKIGEKIHLLSNVRTDDGTDIMYGNRGTVIAEYTSVYDGSVTYEIEIPAFNNAIVVVSPKDIDIYNQPHLSSAFTIERVE